MKKSNRNFNQSPPRRHPLRPDLYDGNEGNFIPWDSLAEFFGKNL